RDGADRRRRRLLGILGFADRPAIAAVVIWSPVGAVGVERIDERHIVLRRDGLAILRRPGLLRRINENVITAAWIIHHDTTSARSAMSFPIRRGMMRRHSAPAAVQRC